MRSRTPKPAERAEPTPGPNDDAYLEYGSLTEGKSRSWGPTRFNGATRALWKRVLGALALVALPMTLLLLSSLWRSASEESVLSAAELQTRLIADKKACDAQARVESSAGLRRDAKAWNRCMVDLGWKLDARSQPVECVGSCRVRKVDAQP